jgi:predicted alpha/beta-fold hydrolase
MIIKSQFKPAWWLRNAHAQTMYPTLTRRVTAAVDKTERLELPDGDFIDLAWVVTGCDAQAPLVIFLHGLGGTIQSSYVAGQLRAYNARGWRAVFVHFRGASTEPNRLPRAYHSGDTEDLNYLIQKLHQREPKTAKAIVGISLGGNVLLKWLGEHDDQIYIQTGVAVSVPFDLHQVAHQFNQGFSRIYQYYLLRKMYRFFHAKLAHYPTSMPDYVRQPDFYRDFLTFDHEITAPLHGFASGADYYRQSSSKQFLSKIKTPTLIIHAKDDPFMTAAVIPNDSELSAAVTLELSDTGGHVGFITGAIPGRPVYWLDERVPDFLAGAWLQKPGRGTGTLTGT